jgi:transcriptional regulator with XRE-family HTH domain
MIRKQQDASSGQSGQAAAEARVGLHARIAAQIYHARTEAGLSQKELAERVGTRQSQIARFEDPCYRGHSLDMLERIADSLGKHLSILICDAGSIDREEIAAAHRLKTSTPPNSVLLKLVECAEVPPEIEDIQEERPW